MYEARRRHLAVAAFLALTAAGQGHAAPAADLSAAKDAAHRDASTMYDAFAKGDFDTFAAYTCPRLVHLMGGKSPMIDLLRKGMADMAKDGFVLKSATIGPPTQIVTAGEELHVLLPMTLVMKAPGGELRAPSHLLGMSTDKGATWTFVDTAQLDAEKVRQVLPSYNPALKLPAKVEPTFVPAAP